MRHWDTYMVGLLSSVNAHVALERLQVAEVRAADLAGIRLLSGVDEHVGSQVRHLLEATAKSHYSEMKAVELDEFPFIHGSSNLDKSGAARLTLVRLLPRVDAGVCLEVGRSVELGAADVAMVGLRTWSRG